MSTSNEGTTVLVTGGSGFIGSHCVNQLLSAGYTVRTTIRSLAKTEQVRAQVLPPSDPSASSRLTFFAANLLDDAGWSDAVSGCHYILHVASPFPLSTPKDENDLIKPAVEGSLRVLRHAESAGVKRVVLTSSYAAIGYGHLDYSKTLDETTWYNPTSSQIPAYPKSKTLAEKAAWDFVAQHPNLELSVINPVAVFGPILPGTKDTGSSVSIVQKTIDGGIPIAPFIKFGAVDVRDVAAMHILAMTSEAAKGQRFLAIAGDGEFVSLQEIGKVLGKTIRVLPDWVARLGSYVVGDLAAMVPELGLEKKASNEKARKVLGYECRGWEEGVLATAESLRKEGICK